jgi:hypothetical protein
MPPTSSDLLQVFTRYPAPGQTKTRLIPALGRKGAARLQFLMTRHLLEQALRLPSGTAVEVRFSGGSEKLMSALFGADLAMIPQTGPDLGSRMDAALNQGLARAERVVLVGSDCPQVDAALLGRAFEKLLDHDVVLGPAADGGYYLIGLTRRTAGDGVTVLFSGIDWGSPGVLDQTWRKASARGWTVAQLATLPDIDLPEDLPLIPPNVLRPEVQGLSVIIPVLNESAHVHRTLASLSREDHVEVLVVDGGSRDGTVQRAEQAGARVLASRAGRAGQMNVGARSAQGELLFFLHGDSQAPFLFDWWIRQGLSRPKASGGSFSFGLDSIFPGSGLITAVANARSRLLGLPYGDQGLFVGRELFFELGGFPETPLLEDVHMVRALNKRGRIQIVPVPVLTSARRWTRLGPLRTTLINQLVMAGFALGVPETRLARLYGRLKTRGGS